jgi:uracil-DNA glycosylase
MTDAYGKALKRVQIEPAFDSWRSAARGFLAARVDPGALAWDDGSQPMAGVTLAEVPAVDPETKIALPKRFMQLAEQVAARRDPGRWALLYRVAYRLVTENRELLANEQDADVARILLLANEVDGPPRAAEPEPAEPEPAEPEPVRVRVEPPAAKVVSERSDLAKLIGDVPGGMQTMVELQRSARSAAPWVPPERERDVLAAASQRCEGCDLVHGATQSVFGEGPETARVMIVGEHPGEEEDLSGHPFAGSAAQLLDRALIAAGLDRAQIYVTNALKHLPHDMRGSRRIARVPKLTEVTACRPWLVAEIEMVNPDVIVCLGATAARAIGGPTFRLMEERGEFIQTKGGRTMIATLHPVAVMRAEGELAAQYQAWFAEDLARVRERLASS